MHTYSRGGMPAPAMMERSGADSVRRIDGGGKYAINVILSQAL